MAHRYFLEVCYCGTNYSGLQKQKNGNSIEEEIEKAFATLFHKSIKFSCSSRTDAGVHAYQNFFHFDFDCEFDENSLYNLNCILPNDIAIKNVVAVKVNAHARFDALSREYEYVLYQNKNPFLDGNAFYYPYPFDIEKMNEAAKLLLQYENFQSFSKTHTDVKTYNCKIELAYWEQRENIFYFQIQSNRFLRGMVRLIVGSLLRVGREQITLEKFRQIIEAKASVVSAFAVPAVGLYLKRVNYLEEIFLDKLNLLSNP